MSGVHRRIVLGLLALSLSSPALAAPPGKPRPTGSDVWFTMGGGYYDGQDYPADPGTNPTVAQQVDGGEAMVAVTIAGPFLARARVSLLSDFTSNTADEIAAMVGFPLGPKRQVYLAAGVSRLHEVSRTEGSPTAGVPVEILYYPTRGLELSLHGNFNPDSDFIGVTIGGVFGKQRAK